MILKHVTNVTFIKKYLPSTIQEWWYSCLRTKL